MADDIDSVPETGAPAGGSSSSSAGRPPQAGASQAQTATPGTLNPKAVKKRQNKRTMWADYAHNLSLKKPENLDANNEYPPGNKWNEVAVEDLVLNDGTVETHVIGADGQPFANKASPPGGDPPPDEPTQKEWDRIIKQNTAASVSVIEINGKRYQITTRKDPLSLTITNEYLDMSTGQKVATLPVDQSAAGKPTVHFSKGQDGKTYYVTIGPDGKMIGTPTDTGLPPDPKSDTYNIPGVGIVRVDNNGKSTLVYEAKKDPNIKLERDTKTGRWYETRVNADGTTSVTEVQVQGSTGGRGGIPMGPLPDKGLVTEWLWSERDKIDKMVAEGKLTPEEAVIEMQNRRDFAQTLVLERSKQDELAEKEKDRNATTMRQREQNAASIYNSVAPKIIESGGGFLPSARSAEVAEKGLRGFLALAQDFTKQMSGAGAQTTIAPDGTITVNRPPAGGTFGPGQMVPPGQPAALPPAALNDITRGLNGGYSVLPPWAGGPAVPAPAPGSVEGVPENVVLPAPGSAPPVNPIDGPNSNPNAPVGMLGPEGPLPVWMQSGAVPPTMTNYGLDPDGPGPLEGALDDIASSDPEWASVLEEARRRGVSV